MWPTRLQLSDSSSDGNDNQKMTDQYAPAPVTRQLTQTQNCAPAEKPVREAEKDLTDQLQKRVDELETRIQQQSSAPVATPHLLPDTAAKTNYATAASPDTTRLN